MKKQPTKNEINKVLVETRKAMGGSKNKIIEYMKANNIKGEFGATSCPLAIVYSKALRQALHKKFDVAVDEKIEVSIGEEIELVITKPITNAEDSFIKYFDNKELPELLKKSAIRLKNNG